MAGEGVEFSLQEIGGVIIATLTITIALSFMFLGFDENTVTTATLGSEASYVATFLPKEHAQVSFRLDEETEIQTSENQIVVKIDDAQTTKTYSNPHDITVERQGNVLTILS